MQLRNPDKIYFESASINGVNEKKLLLLSVKEQDHSNFQSFTNSIIKEISSTFSNVTLIDPSTVFCRLNRCVVGELNESFYFDRDHLSIKGSYKLQKKLEDVLSN